ncbi:MAG TPA: tetratricopeptide repeat protein [Parafilimonas sp.]|nr:tetratricopeptide repeat protein [Parafilimonas sp.]
MKLRSRLLFLFICFAQLAHAQLPGNLDAAQWAKGLSDKNDKEGKTLAKLDSTLNYGDTGYVFHFLSALEKLGKKNNDYFQVRYHLLKARQLNRFYGGDIYLGKGLFDSARVSEVKSLLDMVMKKAYNSEDEHLIVSANHYCARTHPETAFRIMYGLNFIVLSEKLSLYIPAIEYDLLSVELYGVREYDDCIKYAHKAISGNKSSDFEGSNRRGYSLNTIGLAYQKQKMFDSAFKYYRQALEIFSTINNPVWIGIISGNMGQIHYALGNYDTARSLFALAYETSVPEHPAEGANAQQWLSRTELALNNTNKALLEVKQALGTMASGNVFEHDYRSYARNIYYTAAQVFKKLKEYDSAFYYNNLYITLNDSLEQIVAANSLSITRARVNDLNSQHQIQALNREKLATETTRNVTVAGVVVAAAVALLLVNRKRVKIKLEKEKAEQEKLVLQQEMALAQQQLKRFTDSIIEKSALIEKLQHQQEVNPSNEEQQNIVQELVQQSIFTDADWLHFKTIFEKAHPGFFNRLREQANDISQAEMRMAALTRMQFTTRHMADMLGVSPNSVVKAKQRLRQRFNLPTNFEVEEFMRKL